MNLWLLVILLTLPNGKTVETKYATPYTVFVACQEDGEDVLRKLSPSLDRSYKLAYKCLPVASL